MTERDFKILLLLEKWGMLGLGQLDGVVGGDEVDQEFRMDLFFNSRPRNGYCGATYKLMSRLESAGLVQARAYTNMPRLYSLTRSGHDVLKAAGRNGRYRHFEPAEVLVRHELTVAGVGLVWSELLGLRVSTESERYAESQRSSGRRSLADFEFPDLWIEDSSQPKAVEVERTQKSRRRYANLWKGYRADFPPNVVVLYVVCFPGGVPLLLQRAQKTQADHVYFCRLEDFRASLGRGPFQGYRGGMIWLEHSGDHPHGAHSRRVPPASLSAGQDVSTGDRLAAVTFAPPSRPAAGTLTPHHGGVVRGQFVPPPETRAVPRPHPLSSPSPSPEGDLRSIS